MPLYEYRCPEGHSTEEIFLRLADAPDGILCPECDAVASRLFGIPSFKLGWVPTTDDSGRAWEGTPLDGQDLVNPITYKSDKIQVDLGQKTQVSGKSKPRPTRGARALGV